MLSISLGGSLLGAEVHTGFDDLFVHLVTPLIVIEELHPLQAITDAVVASRLQPIQLAENVL